MNKLLILFVLGIAMDVCGQLENDAKSNFYNIDSLIEVVRYSPFGGNRRYIFDELPGYDELSNIVDEKGIALKYSSLKEPKLFLDNKPFTGLVKRKHENGRLKELCEYDHGVINGDLIRFYSTGQIHYRKKFLNGKMDWEYEFYNEPNGQNSLRHNPYFVRFKRNGEKFQKIVSSKEIIILDQFFKKLTITSIDGNKHLNYITREYKEYYSRGTGKINWEGKYLPTDEYKFIKIDSLESPKEYEIILGSVSSGIPNDYSDSPRFNGFDADGGYYGGYGGSAPSSTPQPNGRRINNPKPNLIDGYGTIHVVLEINESGRVLSAHDGTGTTFNNVEELQKAIKYVKENIRFESGGPGTKHYIIEVLGFSNSSGNENKIVVIYFEPLPFEIPIEFLKSDFKGRIKFKINVTRLGQVDNISIIETNHPDPAFIERLKEYIKTNKKYKIIDKTTALWSSDMLEFQIKGEGDSFNPVRTFTKFDIEPPFDISDSILFEYSGKGALLNIECLSRKCFIDEEYSYALETFLSEKFKRGNSSPNNLLQREIVYLELDKWMNSSTINSTYGIPHGEWKEYDFDGKLKSIRMFANGRQTNCTGNCD